ncbi:MAG: DUF1573 domain-containing protein [Armatimonadetes bacterium]|nr:DUF1573 domain-containing protein [Armatimonadota bacterium]
MLAQQDASFTYPRGASGVVLVAVALLAVFMVPGFAAPAASDDAVPRIEIADKVFDFGTMYQAEQVKHAFILRNVGNALLRIEKTKATCGCTVVAPEKRELASGESTPLNVTFRSGSMSGQVLKHVYVDTNDPAEPRVTLTVQGQVKAEIKVSPPGVYLGTLLAGDIVQREIQITPVEVGAFKILEVSSDSPAVSVGKPVPLGDKIPGYKLTIQCGPFDKPGRIRAKITVRTDLKHTKEFQIAVSGKITEEKRGDGEAP